MLERCGAVHWCDDKESSGRGGVVISFWRFIVSLSRRLGSVVRCFGWCGVFSLRAS